MSYTPNTWSAGTEITSAWLNNMETGIEDADTRATAVESGKQDADADLTTIAGLSPSNDDVLQRKAGAWANRTIAQLLADLGLSALYQPLDSDLTTIAGLPATTNNIIMSVSSAWASRTPAQVKAALAIAESDVTNLVSDLAAKQPLDSDLTTIAGLTATTDNFLQAKASAWASRTPAQVAADLVTPLSSSLQPLDSDLTTLAGLSHTNGNVVKSNGSAWTSAPIVPAPHSFTYAATYAPDWANGEHHHCALTGDIEIDPPTNIPSGRTLHLSVTASGAARTVTIDATITRIAGINVSFVVESGKLLRLAIENNPALAGPLVTAKAGT